MSRVTADTKQATRARLLAAAAQEFARAGLERANVDAISLAAGYAKGTIYNYFAPKEELFLAAVLLALLAAQFLAGMITNLYAPIPPAVPGLRGNFDVRLGGAARWALLHGPPELKIHVAVGLAIGACAIALAVLALRARQRP